MSALAMRRVRLAAKPTERRAPSGAKAGSKGVIKQLPLTVCAGGHGEDRRVGIRMAIAVEPGFQFFRRVAASRPLRQRRTPEVGAGKVRKMLQPALLAFGKMQIREAGELLFRLFHRRPAIAVDQIKRGSEAGAVLTA